MADAYTDLAALAAKDPTGKAWLWWSRDCNRWSYPGCAVQGENVKVPVENLPDSRVRAALADGAWVGAVVDVNSTPITVLAVQVAPPPGTPLKVLKATDLGTALAA